MIKRGNGFYGVYCRACHGTDLRGGDQGGPNLLRSQLVLNDQAGELITAGRPAGPARTRHARHAAAEHSGRRHQGDRGLHPQRHRERPRAGRPAARGRRSSSTSSSAMRKAGQAYFKAKCTACHTDEAMQGIATRVSDAMALQNFWVAGGRGGGGRGALAPSVGDGDGHRGVRPEDRRTSRPTRRLLRRRRLADGTSRSFRRDGDVPKVDVKRSAGSAPQAPADLHRQRHSRRDCLSGDPEMTIKHMIFTTSVAAATAVMLTPAFLSGQAQGGLDPASRSASRSPTRGRPIRATTRAGATARSSRSTRRRSRTSRSRGPAA